MKIIFVIPPNIHYIEPYSYIPVDKNNTMRPPLGLLYVAAQLRQTLNIAPQIIDAAVDDLCLKDLIQRLENEKPDLIGFSVLTFNLLNCMDVASKIRQALPNTKICLGGWHPTLYPVETLRLHIADYIVMGEGEHTFCDLVRALKEGTDISNIHGLAYKTGNGEICVNPRRDLIENLDSLPFPAYNMLDISKYSNIMADTRHLINIMTSRGCPHKCTFCDIRRTRYRARSPQNILSEMTFWHNAGYREFYIQDDNFTINRKNIITFCQLLIASGMDIKYKISSRVDTLDEEMVRLLKKSGCYRIHFGIESGSQRILDSLQKGITVQEIHNTFALCRKYGIDRFAYVMIGIPGETDEDIKATERLIQEIAPEHLHCSICTPMPRTFLYETMIRQGDIPQDYWRSFAEKPDPNFRTPFASRNYSSAELRHRQDKLQRSFYFNPRRMIREAIKTRSLKQLSQKAKLAFRMLFH